MRRANGYMKAGAYSGSVRLSPAGRVAKRAKAKRNLSPRLHAAANAAEAAEAAAAEVDGDRDAAAAATATAATAADEA